jgi:hypothetical protein
MVSNPAGFDDSRRDPAERSVMGAVTPRGRIATMVRQESLNGLHTIEFLLHLGRVVGDRLLFLVRSFFEGAELEL